MNTMSVAPPVSVAQALSSHHALLSLAEYLRLQQPPCLRESIHCVQATLAIENLPAKEKAFSRLSLAKMLLAHTRNTAHARAHLEEAHQLTSYLPDEDLIFLESASLLANVCSEQGQNTVAKTLLRETLQRSNDSSYKKWHYTLIFQLAEAHAHDKEFSVAVDLLSLLGEETAKVNNHSYVRLLFIMCKCMLLLADKDLQKFEGCLQEAEKLKKQFTTTYPIRTHIVNCFYGFLKAYYFMVCAQPKSAKEDLKRLQENIQLLVSTPEQAENAEDAEAFQWMSKEHMCILVYLVKVMHCVHTGYIDRALRHTEKALTLIEKLKAGGNERQLTLIFNLSLLEHAVMCRIVEGHGAQAIQEIGKACQLCHHDSKLTRLMKPKIHTLLGLYAMSMNLMTEAETHFNKSLSLCTNQDEVFYVAALNLAIIYIRLGEPRVCHFKDLLSRFDEQAITKSKSLRSSYFYMQGLKAFFNFKFEDARVFLRESLRIGNTEDLSRLTSCSLILLGHVIFSTNNSQEALHMVLPAMQVANKIPDVYLQLWASSLLKDLYQGMSDVPRHEESAQLHNKFTTQLLQDHFLAAKRPEHALLKDYI